MRRAKRRLDLINAYGGKCACCGETESEFLILDHIDGGGNKHRKEIGRTSMGRWARKHNYPDTLQLLCANCNLSKELGNEFCIHKRRELHPLSNVL
jgi:hypothetical protein